MVCPKCKSDNIKFDGKSWFLEWIYYWTCRTCKNKFMNVYKEE